MEGGGENTPMQVSVTDLMNNRFETREEQTGGGQVERAVDDDELSLGLSMNGKFGVDIKWRGGGASNLARFSSSIPELIDFPVLSQGRTTCGGDSKEVASMMSTDKVGLMRSSSLPLEGVEEWKKRKTLQSLRRMEAKRKRSEKQRMLRACRESSYNRDRNSCLEDSSANSREKSVIQSNLKTQVSCVPFDFKGERKNGFVGGGPVAVGGGGGQAVPISLPTIPKQRSLPPQGGGGRGIGNGSFGIGQMESPAIRGVDKFTEVRSPLNPMMEQNVQRAPADFGSKIARSSSLNGNGMEHPSVERMVSDNEKKEEANNRMFDMLYVSTTGDGPDGKRVEGFLCQYKNGEELRIVCVCHGDCLTPAEFVKHGGGGDVAYPLKHIVVTTTAFV